MKYLFLLLLLTSCYPKEGKVLSKKFDPAHQEWNITTEMSLYETNTIENLLSFPDRWFLIVTPDGTSQWTVAVSSQVYSKASNGVWWHRGKGIIKQPK